MFDLNQNIPRLNLAIRALWASATPAEYSFAKSLIQWFNTCYVLQSSGWIICLLGLAGCQSEKAYWEFAKATIQAEEGDLDKAIPQMKQAVLQSGNDPVLTLSLAQWMAEQGNPDSIEMFDRVLADRTVRSFSSLERSILQRKIFAQQQLGDFQGALGTCKQILNETTVRSDRMLNLLAYCRALAEVELQAALDDINQAIRYRQSATSWDCGDRFHLRGKTVVANALLARSFLYETKRNPRIEPIQRATLRIEQAIEFLNDLVDEYEDRTRISRARYNRLRSRPPRPSTILDGDRFPFSLEDAERRYCGDKMCLVVARTARALLYQDLENFTASNRDRLRVQELNKDSDEIVLLLPDELESLELLDNFSIAFLDTKGFVLNQIAKADETALVPTDPFRLLFTTQTSKASLHQKILRYLDTAVFAIQIQRRALEGELYNRIDFPVSLVRKMQTQALRTEAVLRYHRWQAYQVQQLAEMASREAEAIRDLGFELDDRLF